MPPFLATLIRLSLLGTALALVLALALRLLKGRVSRTAGYYLWLLVLLRLAVPLGVMIPLPAAQAQTAPQATNAAVQSHASPGWALPAAPDAQDTPVGQESAESPQTEQPDRASGSLWRADWVWTGIWALGAAIWPLCLGLPPLCPAGAPGRPARPGGGRRPAGPAGPVGPGGAGGEPGPRPPAAGGVPPHHCAAPRGRGRGPAVGHPQP